MDALMATQIDEQDKNERGLAQLAITDIDAFAELYHRHLTRVYRYHVAHIGNARDATMMAMSSTCSSRHSNRNSSCRSWCLGSHQADPHHIPPLSDGGNCLTV